MRLLHLLSASILFSIFIYPTVSISDDNWLPLDGQWRFALDKENQGVKNSWFNDELKDQITLPGTTDENRKGSPNDNRNTGKLTRAFPYYGVAWYQRDIDIPNDWSGKRIVLFLERTKTTHLWLDDKDLGEQNSLVAPHEYVLGNVSPGKHRLTVLVDNNNHPPIGDPHQISDETQTNWNGVIGKIGLKATDSVWIDDIQIYPLSVESSQKAVRLKIKIGNASNKAGQGKLLFSVKGDGYSRSAPASDVSWDAEGGSAEIVVPLDDVAKFWNEFQPSLNILIIKLTGDGISDEHLESFGLRNFTTQDRQFRINSSPTFLRGKHDACVFPLTGYPPMTVEGWLRVFAVAKQYGINHYRFHSWCPPDAAFEAADQMGIYIQAELPNWMGFGRKPHDDFMKAEGERILRYYGNHPSFVMLSLGNELGGKQLTMAPFITHFRKLDNRHLYAQGTNNWFGKPDPGDDYLSSFQVDNKKVRGSFATVNAPLGHVQLGPPSTQKDYYTEIQAVSVPVVGHEIGEYQVAPDFSELKKYTGVLKPYNLETFKKRLEDKGMLNLADDFLKASGALTVVCYREDIEAALRTRNFGGFQLLDLQDFPGQGTALVGILNAFMQSKGLIEPSKWREFCSETVPLVRMKKYTWISSEPFTATAEVAHYGPTDIEETAPTWSLRDTQGKSLASGRLPITKIRQGTITKLGEINIPLDNIPSPAKLNLELSVDGIKHRNSYDIWLYPAAVDVSPGKVTITRQYDDIARKALLGGGCLLLLPETAKLPNSIEGTFASDFWNFGMFRNFAEKNKAPIAPGTLGILCDPNHPAFQSFPTDFHSNWQWFHLLTNSKAIILDSMPKDYRPTLQVIDNYERLHKLGSIFELRVGSGKLLVCSIDLPGQKDKPEARQLLHSLLQYMNSDKFNPSTTVDEKAIEQLFKNPQKTTENPK